MCLFTCIIFLVSVDHNYTFSMTVSYYITSMTFFIHRSALVLIWYFTVYWRPISFLLPGACLEALPWGKWLKYHFHGQLWTITYVTKQFYFTISFLWPTTLLWYEFAGCSLPKIGFLSVARACSEAVDFGGKWLKWS